MQEIVGNRKQVMKMELSKVSWLCNTKHTSHQGLLEQ